MAQVQVDTHRQNILKPEQKDNIATSCDGPLWITASYLESVLQKFMKNQKIQVSRINVKSFGENGDGFASSMYSIESFVSEGDGSMKKGCYILKMMPLSEIACGKLGKDSYNVQEKEMDIFQNIFPEFSRILKTIDEDKNIFPQAIAVDRIRDALILENLKVKGFVMADRKVGLDMKHMKLTINKLARFHAASYYFMQKNPKMFQNYDIGMFSRKTTAFCDYYYSNMDILIEEVSSWKGYEMYVEKLKNVRKDLYERGCKASDNEPGDLKVLTHCDLWINNMMFKYDKENNPIDSIMLDFQFCSVSHPAVDLFYLFYSSCQNDLRQNKIFYLLQYYYYELKNVLVKLNCDLSEFPSLHMFQVQVMKKYFYAFPTALLTLPLMLSEEPDTIFDNIHTHSEQAYDFKRRIYKNPKMQQVIKNSLPIFDQFGLLDEM